jgi:hypothetical protein
VRGSRPAAIVAVLQLVAAGCSTTTARPAEFDRTANFNRYWVYEWTSRPREGSSDLDLIDWRIRTAVDGQLALKGRRKRVAGENADFLVGYRLMVEEATIDTFGEYFEYRRAGGSGSPQEAYVEGYEEAKLVLEMFDASERRLLWRASAKAVVDAVRARKQNERIDTVVREMLAGFPPQ